MNTEKLSLSEINHTGQDKYCMVFYLDILSKYSNSETESRMPEAQDWGKWGDDGYGYTLSFKK